MTTTPGRKPAPRTPATRRKPSPKPIPELAKQSVGAAVQVLDEDLGVEKTNPDRVVVAGSIVFTAEDDDPFGPWIGYQLAVEQGVLEPLRASVS